MSTAIRVDLRVGSDRNPLQDLVVVLYECGVVPGTLVWSAVEGATDGRAWLFVALPPDGIKALIHALSAAPSCSAVRVVPHWAASDFSLLPSPRIDDARERGRRPSDELPRPV